MAFCRYHGFRAEDGEIIAIIRRMDIDADSRVGQHEFFSFMKPAEDVQRIPCELHQCNSPE
jgi:hypothetical protein